MNEVVWSINIMMGVLMSGVSAMIVYIFKYDDWYPNEQSQDSGIGITSSETFGETEGID